MIEITAKVNLNEMPAWKALQSHFDRTGKKLNLKQLFGEDSNRFEAFSRRLEDPKILVDFSKNLIDSEGLELLLQIGRDCGVEAAREAMFEGYPINSTEGRAVLHTALRAGPILDSPMAVRDEKGRIVEQNVVPAVQAELEKMKKISESVRNGSWRGFRGGDRIRSVVNIGIGGSDLGPSMVYEALKAWRHPEIECHFVSNVDDGHLKSILPRIKAESTLFVVVSKTFTTAETMKNAQSAREWLLEAFNNDRAAVSSHFVAVSTNLAAVESFGIDSARNTIQFWDWVGGRYSLWSGVGLSVMMSIGWESFSQMLSGARAIDNHFRTAPLNQNIPVLMALLGIWYNNFWGCETVAVLPYEQALSRFPAYLQQADMESNGKGNRKSDGAAISYQTGPIVWGEPGTNGQHAFFQLIHQGTKMIPCDFLAGVHPVYPETTQTQTQSQSNTPSHHKMLLANFLAQTEALMVGKDLAQVDSEHALNFVPPPTIDRSHLLPQKTFPGNRPSTSILYDRLTPKTLGALIALYEHKIFVQGVIWGVNSFDQWGVELGKQLASKILKELTNADDSSSSAKQSNHDQSTQNLINYIKSF